MKSSLLALAAAAVVAVPLAAHATPNLLSNGSFEANGGSLSGWTISGSGTTPGTGPTVFVTDGHTPGEFGDVVAADNAASASPDAAGTHAVYFVDDAANESLSQTISLLAGQTYAVGFDYYATQSGAYNPSPFTLTASLGAQTVASVTNATAIPIATWLDASNSFTAATNGAYTFTFDFASGAYTAKDVLIDKVYVTAAATAVPEPMAVALFATGLLALGVVYRRRAV